jgi:hypothetical protein
MTALMWGTDEYGHLVARFEGRRVGNVQQLDTPKRDWSAAAYAPDFRYRQFFPTQEDEIGRASCRERVS